MRKRFRSIVGSVAGVLLSALAAGSACGAEKTFGPFTVDEARPDVIIMNGAIDASAALNFRRALQAAPGARLISLNSPGGNVQMGLLIADDIHQRKLATYIAKDSTCYSACSFIFLAGAERKVDGALGVHQISSVSSDLVDAQLTISDIIEVLNRFGTPMDVMHVMFKTPPDDMHVFTQDEIRRYNLNRSGGDLTVSPAVVDAPAGVDGESHAEASLNPPDIAGNRLPVQGASHQPDLSPIEEFTRRPNRIAIYTGLDLFGDDISSVRVEDAAACANSCLLMDGACKAFTFNTNPKIRKSARGRTAS